MNNIIEKILNLIYPNVCGVCTKINKESLCKKCEIKLREYELKSKRINILVKANENEKYIDELYAIYRYDGLIRDLILKYKFQNKAYLYKTFSKIILNNKKICGFLKKYDIIVPVPIHKEKMKKRGYNQTELIARDITEKLSIKLENNLLKKVINTKAQSELSKKERKTNVIDVFKVINKNKAKDKNILIFDDIYTTGSTTLECARILKEAGANKISVFTIAKD